MNYPLLSEYVESIRSAEDNLAELNYLHPVLDANGDPVMTGGNFAVVFKMQDKNTGKYYALKCFTKEQEGRAESYKLIAEELEFVNTTYFTHFKYYDKELFVDCANSDEIEFPVVLMDWVEGITLDKYIREHIDDQYKLSLLAYQFSRLAMWLMPQPFAHGDLKPDNILVQDDGTLVLVDYDGMYVPAMKGQKARELGSPDFRHPSRTEDDFDEHIDDFALASILLSLKAISLNSDLEEEYGASDRLLFSEKDYRNLSESEVMDAFKPLMQDSELASLYSLFILATSQINLRQVLFHLFNLSKPDKVQYERNEQSLLTWSFIEFARLHGKPLLTRPRESVNSQTNETFVARSVVFEHPTEKDEFGRQKITFVDVPSNLIVLSAKEFGALIHELVIVQLESGKYMLKRIDDESNIFNKDKNEKISNMELPDGSIYNGDIIVKQFGSIELCGSGELVYKNGDKYKGEFKYGRPYGWGKYTFRNGYTHKGFFDGSPKGIGYLNEDYNMSLGYFSEGQINGWGICYRNRLFKFGFWEHGKLIKDLTKETLWVRYEISNHRFEYKGNLIQIGKEYDFIRLGIPQKLLDTPIPEIPLSKIPKLPAWGFEFFQDGIVKVGLIKDHISGEYMLCKRDGSVETGKWKENKKTYDFSSFDVSNMGDIYEEDGLDVYKKI